MNVLTMNTYIKKKTKKKKEKKKSVPELSRHGSSCASKIYQVN